ncbi:uncharacterized protein M421DRAFT_88988 [Didymella exigua CBS 183.55]|uniref:Uncharacterized protein n=1 Tax=Didymella exigua CBS 183.55 TaxID=1150837 RepID=A0A6A5RYK5_9PLEO|nr:uncharacterized protein M421DRAFT_88988 [Didymella exigua CBS 183.55]KAF1932609.1 hypothetical protein M421DRAFT_88988 [Didymella exigua CBS 183.55]
MASSSPTITSALMLPPPSNGQTRAAAEWSRGITWDPAQQAFIVEVILPFRRWETCTKSEAVTYAENGYIIWDAITGAVRSFETKTNPRTAFHRQIESVVYAEQDPECAV